MMIIETRVGMIIKQKNECLFEAKLALQTSTMAGGAKKLSAPAARQLIDTNLRKRLYLAQLRFTLYEMDDFMCLGKGGGESGYGF